MDTAIQSIYRDLEYAKSLIKHRDQDGKHIDDAAEESIEESWTFIGDDNDPELIRGIHEWQNMASSPHRRSMDARESLDMGGRSLGNRVLSGAGASTTARRSINLRQLAT